MSNFSLNEQSEMASNPQAMLSTPQKPQPMITP
jgi:hypothetical protein